MPVLSRPSLCCCLSRDGRGTLRLLGRCLPWARLCAPASSRSEQPPGPPGQLFSPAQRGWTGSRAVVPSPCISLGTSCSGPPCSLADSATQPVACGPGVRWRFRLGSCWLSDFGWPFGPVGPYLLNGDRPRAPEAACGNEAETLPCGRALHLLLGARHACSGR